MGAKNGFCLLSNWQLPQLPVLSVIVSSVNGRATIACINDPLEPKLYRHTFLPLAKYSATIFGQKFFPFFNQLLLYIAYFECMEMLGTERTSGKMHPHTTTNLSVCFWLCFIVGLSLSASLVRSPCNVRSLYRTNSWSLTDLLVSQPRLCMHRTFLFWLYQTMKEIFYIVKVYAFPRARSFIVNASTTIMYIIFQVFCSNPFCYSCCCRCCYCCCKLFHIPYSAHCFKRKQKVELLHENRLHILCHFSGIYRLHRILSRKIYG